MQECNLDDKSLMHFAHRLQSLKPLIDKGRISNAKADDLAWSGFACIANEIECFFCRLRFSAVETTHIDDFHRAQRPHCPFIKNRHERGTDSSDDNDNEEPSAKFARRSRIPISKRYATLGARLETFADAWAYAIGQCPEVLAEAGFYSLKSGDRTECYHCGVVLRNWKPEDDPWREHAKWSPTCHHVYLSKGLRYVHRVTNLKHFALPKLDDEIDTLEDVVTCVMCHSAPNEVCFAPCGHVVACETCARGLRTCPLCRRYADKTVKIKI